MSLNTLLYSLISNPSHLILYSLVFLNLNALYYRNVPRMPQKYDSLSDIHLMQQTAKGDKAAFTEIVHRYQNFLLNFFCYMGADRNKSEDLVQETFIRLYKYRKRYTASAGFKTFLSTLARNTRIDWLRKKRRTSEKEVPLTDAVHKTDASKSAVTEKHMDISAALSNLSDKLRDVVVLNVYQGLNYKEIGDILDIPEGTVKSRMHLAIGKLREFFNEDRQMLL